jgi:hypothetical protein
MKIAALFYWLEVLFDKPIISIFSIEDINNALSLS